MSEQEIIIIIREQEEEINDILNNSSLYLDMSPADRQNLLHYLVSFYFNLLPSSSLNYVRKLLQTNDKEKQIQGLRKIPLSNQSISAFWLPVLASIIEIIIGIVFWRFFSWNIF